MLEVGLAQDLYAHGMYSHVSVCMCWQIPGRMSDSAVAGAGAYAETGVGGCGSTGDGDIHLRFLPCYQACPSHQCGPDSIRTSLWGASTLSSVGLCNSSLDPCACSLIRQIDRTLSLSDSQRKPVSHMLFTVSIC